MKGIELAILAALLSIGSSVLAQPIYIAKIPFSDGVVIHEFYLENALISECRNTGYFNPSALISKMETPRGVVTYGTGCWVARIDGNIWIAVKSIDDGIVRETVIHNSKLEPPKPKTEPRPQFVEDLIKEVEANYKTCKGVKRAKVGEQAGPCDSMDEAIMLLKKEGYCMKSAGTANANNKWAKCR